MRPEVGATGANLQHPDRSLARLTDGSFEIRAAGQRTIHVARQGAVWRIDGVESGSTWNLARAAEQTAGFVLRREAGGDEVGRTMPIVGSGRESGPRFLLLDDGRLFRIVSRDAGRGGYELLGWEAPGAYVTARPDGERWVLTTSAAAAGLEGLDVIAILMGAEILDAERPFGAETT